MQLNYLELFFLPNCHITKRNYNCDKKVIFKKKEGKNKTIFNLTNYEILNLDPTLSTNFNVYQIQYTEIKHSDWIFQAM